MRFNRIVSWTLITTLVLNPLFFVNYTLAAKLNNASLKLSTTKSSALSQYTFRFDFVGGDNLGSIAFIFCNEGTDQISTSCTSPNGLDVSNASLSLQSGNNGFNILSATSNRIILTRTPSLSTAGTSQYNFDNITNPSTPQISSFVRIDTYETIDASGAVTDTANLSFSTHGSFDVGGYVPPYLTFCGAKIVSINCQSSQLQNIELGQLSPTSTNYNSTQLAASTNDEQGYIITYIGSTLTSGNNTINAMTSNSQALAGSSQFGMNATLNTNPAVGGNIEGPGSGAVNSNYSIANSFRFNSGEQIASSAGATDFNRYTISVIANIPNNQAGGQYSSTINFIASATF